MKNKCLIFTRKEFEKMYGKCEDWLWDCLVRNYQSLPIKTKEKYRKSHSKKKVKK